MRRRQPEIKTRTRPEKAKEKATEEKANTEERETREAKDFSRAWR